jgi:hypothetical protein
MPGDTRHSQRVEMTFRYSEELSEDEMPPLGRTDPVITQDGYARVKKWQIQRAFYFLTATSTLCLTAVALVPRPPMQATALGIWVASAGLARFLLSGAYQRSGNSGPPEG